MHLAQLRKRQINCVYFLSLRESGLVKASVASPHSFPYIPAPSKNQVPGAALHFASCFVVFRRLFSCFFFLMLPDHQLSSSKRATRSPHDDKPNRAPPDPRTLPRPAAGTRLWREAIRYFRTRPKKSNRYNHFFWKPCRGRTAACTSASAFSRTLVRRDDRERTRRARARARRACVSEDRRTENRKELVAPFCDR